MSIFKVGQQVVCIGTFQGGHGDETDPVVGDVYTIRDIVKRPEGFIALLLEEIRNNPAEYLEYSTPTECSFPAEKFRPLIERKTSIAIFTAMLTPQGVDA